MRENTSEREIGLSAEKPRPIMAYLLLVFAYVVSGKLGLLLALPPGYASAIFPPAGIAVAAVLIKGRGALSWIFLGSLLLNLWVSYGTGHLFEVIGVAAATIIAAASMLQAAAGGFWLRRLIGYPAPLDKASDLLRFLLSAPAICLTSATLSVAGLWGIGVVATDSLSTSWITWWIGDTLGVLVMLPLALVMAGEPRGLWRNRSLTVAVPMLLAFALFVLSFIQVNKWEREDSLMEFRLLSQQIAVNIQAQFEEQSSLLEQLEGLFKTSDHVTRQEFHLFVEKSLIRFPMIHAVEWAPRVDLSRRASFEKAQRSEVPGFEIRERDPAGRLQRAGKRDRYYPVNYVEPLAGNEDVVGFDLASTPRRQMALAKSIETGAIIATPQVHLIQADGTEKAVLLLLAVREGGDDFGVVLTVLKMNSFMEKLLSAAGASLYVRFDDLDGIDGRHTLYDSFPAGTGETAFERRFEFGTRHYRLQTAPTPAYLAQHHGWQSWGVLVIGLLGTGLLGSLLLLGTGYTAHAEALVVERTGRLAKSEAQLREAQRMAHTGSWELDQEQNILFWSDEIYHIFEIDPLAFGASYDAFLAIVHPEDRQLVDSSYTESVKNRTPYDLEHRLLFPDGRIKYVREHCETFYDPEGRPVRSAGTVQDITERKKAEDEIRRAATEIEDLYNRAPCGYHSLDANGVIVRINDTELQWLGYARDEVVEKLKFSDLVTSASLRTFQRNFPQFLERGWVQDLEFDLVRKDGSVFTALLNATAIYDASGHYLMSRSTLFDITERKLMEKTLQESEERFRGILEHAPIGMATVSLSGKFLQANRALCEIVGYSKEELEGLTFQAITHPDDLDLDLANAQRLLNGEIQSYQMEKRYIRKNGEVVWIQLTGSILRSGEAPRYFIAQIEDITERKRSQEQIRQLAYYDTLTNLPNRRLLLDRMHHALSQAKHHGRSMAIMFLDLDHFKQINDTLGHDVGDELLKVVAKRLSTCIRSGDTVSRQGGDEFVIILEEVAHSQDAALVAEKTIKTLSEPVIVREHELHITTSIGIAIYPVNGTDDVLELMKKADMAMYSAKEAGRNQFRFYPAESVG